MIKDRRTFIRLSVLAMMLITIWMVQWSTACGEFYARKIYPILSFVLSSFSSLFPFSLGDLFIFGSIVGVIIYPIYGKYKQVKVKRILSRIGEYLLWLYVWFYMAWGLNYSRQDFYERTAIKPEAYDSESFKCFIEEYLSLLNESFTPIQKIDPVLVAQNIKEAYKVVSHPFGLAVPQAHVRVKTMLFTPFISKTGILGYMGPFFNEFNVNGDLLPVQYPSTYAHEMAHLLGISSEAEANLYAFLTCTSSKDQRIRFSGYFSLFPHVLSNARNTLNEEEYKQWIEKVRPEIITLYKEQRKYWNEKYSPVLGDMQELVYNLYLKGNKIDSGTKNYSEVITLLMSHQMQQKNK